MLLVVGTSWFLFTARDFPLKATYWSSRLTLFFLDQPLNFFVACSIFFVESLLCFLFRPFHRKNKIQLFFLFWISREFFLASKYSSCGCRLEIFLRYSSSTCLSKSLEEVLIFFRVRKSFQFVKYLFKATIISIIFTMLAKIRVIHELIEVLFYAWFCVLSHNLVHNN